MNRIFCFLIALLPALACFTAADAHADQVTGLRGPVNDIRQVPENAAQIRFSYAPLVKKVSPSVVNVYAARQVRRQRSPFAGDPFFERFFGENAFGGRPRQRTARSLGSGVIIGEDGVVITNHHVIENADEVKVALSDGRELPAEIRLVDKKSDLAVLQVLSEEIFPAVSLGDSDNLEVGDLVLAIGNPFWGRTNRDKWNCFRSGAQPNGHHRFRLFYPDRRVDQSRQFRWCARCNGWFAGWYQHSDLLAFGRL